MDVVFSKRVEVGKATAEIVAAGLTQGPRFHGVSFEDIPGSPTTTVHLPDDATPDELAIVSTSIESHDGLGALKDEIIERLGAECQAYIYGHYDVARQASLNALFTEAALSGLQGRAAYVGSALSWIKSVISYYYQVKDQLLAAADEAEVASVTWDFSSMDSGDPQITLRAALEMGS